MLGTVKNMTIVAASLSVVVALTGCNVDGQAGRSRWAPEPGSDRTSARVVSAGDGIDIAIADAREVDLVEALVSYRSQYQRTLRDLHDFYRSHGYTTKQGWAALELQGMRSVKASHYLLDAEVASDSLRPADQIGEADTLFEEGCELMRRGGHDVPGLYRRDRMIEAAGVFREMIQEYPTSDKIDDAAFLLGKIHDNYLPGQEPIAVRWYERTFTWNPQTSHPARFQAAVVYDYRLHDRDRALELYQAAVLQESGHGGNVRFATRRIDELTSGGSVGTSMP